MWYAPMKTRTTKSTSRATSWPVRLLVPPQQCNIPCRCPKGSPVADELPGCRIGGAMDQEPSTRSQRTLGYGSPVMQADASQQPKSSVRHCTIKVKDPIHSVPSLTICRRCLTSFRRKARNLPRMQKSVNY